MRGNSIHLTVWRDQHQQVALIPVVPAAPLHHELIIINKHTKLHIHTFNHTGNRLHIGHSLVILIHAFRQSVWKQWVSRHLFNITSGFNSKHIWQTYPNNFCVYSFNFLYYYRCWHLSLYYNYSPFETINMSYEPAKIYPLTL